jgi:hypothetical protein
LLRVPLGGGAARVRGARLMASGIAEAKWNNADVVSADVDWDAVRAWYGVRDVPWGVRVPLELDVDVGEPLFVKRCVAIEPDAWVAVAAPTVKVRRAGTSESALVAALDCEIFGGGDPAPSRAWVEPEVGAAGFRHFVAEVGGTPAGGATTILTDGDAGPAAYLTAFGAVPGAPWREVVEALVAEARGAAFDDGAAFVHANPDADEWDVLAAAGAVEVPGLQVRVVRW